MDLHSHIVAQPQLFTFLERYRAQLCVTWTKTNLCEHAPFSRKGSKNKENSYHMVPLPNQDVFNIDLNDLQIGYWIKCHLNILSYGIPGNCLSQETARLQWWVLFFTEYWTQNIGHERGTAWSIPRCRSYRDPVALAVSISSSISRSPDHAERRKWGWEHSLQKLE